MHVFDFRKAVKNWSSIPVANVGYLPSEHLKNMSKGKVHTFVVDFEKNRYSLSGWRNTKNLWREYMGLDTTQEKHILDFGCGYGIEALQFLKTGNTVSIADICSDNLEAASRVAQTFGYKIQQKILVRSEYPFFESEQIDIFYANGVLHHTPKAMEILQRVHELLSDKGEVRLLLYSDILRKRFSSHKEFVAKTDSVSIYTDWYDKKRINRLCGNLYKVELMCLIGRQTFYAVILRKREGGDVL